MWATAAAVQLVLAKRDLGGQVNAGFAASRVAGGTKLGKEVLSGTWNEYGLPLLKASIGNWTAYAQALGDGVSIFNTQDTAAKSEIEALIQELDRWTCWSQPSHQHNTPATPRCFALLT